MLLILLLGTMLSAQPSGQRELDCRKATLMHALFEAQVEFFEPYANGKTHNGKGAAQGGWESDPASLQYAHNQYTGNCRTNGGSPTCDNAKRLWEGLNKWLPTDRMSTDTRTCEIYRNNRPGVSEVDAPAAGFERALFFSMYKHEKQHQEQCYARNKQFDSVFAEYTKNDFDNIVQQQRKWRELNEQADTSPHQWLAVNYPRYFAADEYLAHSVSKDTITEYLKENCFDDNVKFTGPSLKGGCDLAPPEGTGTLERKEPLSSRTPSGPNAPDHKQPRQDSQGYRLKSAYPPKASVPENEVFELKPGESAEVHVVGGCDCCRQDSSNVEVAIYGGPEQSILVGVAKPGIGVVCTASTDCGSASGDPHICTHDQLMYDFQGVGEFVLSRTKDFEVQARFIPIGANRVLSTNGAMAAKFGEDRVALYAGNPVRLTINGQTVQLEIGNDFRFPSGLYVRRDKQWYRFSINGYVVESTANAQRLGTILVRVPEKTDAVGLLGNRNGDRADDLRVPGGETLSKPIKHGVLYGRFGNAWRVTAQTSLFDYAKGESSETFADLKYPERATSIRKVSADERKKAEGMCRKAGVTNAINLENCIFDVAMTGDETFAQDAAAAAEPLARLETADGGTSPEVVRRSMADGVSLEIPSVVMASYPLEVKITGPIRGEGHQIRTIPTGGGPRARATNPGSSWNMSGGERSITLAAPYAPGDYELVYLSPGGRNILLSVPFRVIAPTAEIFAPDTVELGQTVEIRIVGDISPNTIINIVPVGSPVTVIRDHNFLKGGLEVTTRVVLLHSKTPGEYEIRYMSRGVYVYSRRPLTIK